MRIRRAFLLAAILISIPAHAFCYFEEEDGVVYESTYNDQQFSEDGDVSYSEMQAEFPSDQSPRHIRTRQSETRQYYGYEEEQPKTRQAYRQKYEEEDYAELPRRITPQGENVIVIDPRALAWGAYSSNGQLIKSGPASAGANWCSDIGRSCRTKVGSFRIFSLGSIDCVSSLYPVGEGGAPMPYCMFFNGGQGLHGSDGVSGGNRSHGCVRLYESDAQWIRFNFARVGTKVIVRPY